MEPESHDLLMEVESYATVITILSEYEDSKTIRTTCLSFLESIFADKNHCLTICEREGLPHLVRDLENKHHDKLISYLNILSVVFKHGLTVKMIFQCGVLVNSIWFSARTRRSPRWCRRDCVCWRA